jgi:hypothetical protein
MAADDFKVDFSGNDANLVKVIERQESRIRKLEESLKKAGQSGAKGALDITKGFDALGKKLLVATVGLQGIQKGVHLVSAAYAEWNQRLIEITKSQDELAAKTLEAVAAGGLQANRDQVVGGLKGGALPLDQALDVYKEAAAAARGKVASDRLIEISRGAGAGAVAGMDPKLIAKRAAQLAAGDKGKNSVDDLLDMAAKLTPEQIEQLDKPGGGGALTRNKGLRDAARGDYFSRAVESGLRTPEGQRMAERLQREREVQLPDKGELDEGDWMRRGEEWIDKRVKGRGPIGEVQRKLLQFGVSANRWAGDDAMTANARVIGKFGGSEATDQFLSRQAEANEAILKELKTLNAATAAQGNRRTGVAPDNRHGEN